MSSIAASGDTALPLDAGHASAQLKTRIVSAAVLAPLVLAAVYFGFPYFDLLVVAAVVVMAWEWRSLCAEGSFDLSGYLFASAVGIAAAAASLGYFGAAFLFVFGGGIAVFALAASRAGRPALWTAAGVFAVGLAGISLVGLRAHADGLWITIWFLGAVWATDIAAFFTGRAVGGPKLAPAVSPGKTWAGLLGGIAAAAAWSFLWALWTDVAQPGTLAILGAGTAVLAQLGDLGVSMVKRRFGAKDSSALIPGHGGLLDRVDGLIGAAPFVALSIVVAKGDMSLWA